MKLLTLEDYQKAGETFWPKYWYIAKELGEDAKAEDILRVMEAIGGVALKFALEEKEGPFGFNKKGEIPPTDTATGVFEYPEVSDPSECEKYRQVGVKENGVWKCCDI